MAKTKDKIYAPTLYECIYLPLLGGALLVIGVILSALRNYDVSNYNFFSSNAKNFLDTKLKFLDTPRWSTIITFALWMICGMLVYIAIWFVTTVIVSYREDSLPLHGFLTPRGYNRQKEKSTAIARGLIRFIALVFSIIWIIILLRSLLPYLTHVFAAALSPFTFQSLPTLLAASLLQGAGFFLLLVLLRFIFLRKRLLSRNVTD